MREWAAGVQVGVEVRWCRWREQRSNYSLWNDRTVISSPNNDHTVVLFPLHGMTRRLQNSKSSGCDGGCRQHIYIQNDQRTFNNRSMPIYSNWNHDEHHFWLFCQTLVLIWSARWGNCSFFSGFLDFRVVMSFCGQSLAVSVSKWVNFKDDAAGKQNAAERLQCEDFNRTVWADGRKRRRSASSYGQTHIYKHSHTYTQHTLCRRDSCTLTCASSDFVVLSLVFFTLSRSLSETRTCTCINQIVIADWLNLSGIRLLFTRSRARSVFLGKAKVFEFPPTVFTS